MNPYPSAKENNLQDYLESEMHNEGYNESIVLGERLATILQDYTGADPNFLDDILEAHWLAAKSTKDCDISEWVTLDQFKPYSELYRFRHGQGYPATVSAATMKIRGFVEEKLTQRFEDRYHG